MFKNHYDSHLHSRNSHDGDDPVVVMCEAAIERGLKGVAFTDHCDIGSGNRICRAVKDRLWAEVQRARDLYGPQLRIAMGLEIGEPHHNPTLTNEILDDDRLDFIIGSLHQLRNEEDFYFIDYDNADLDALMGRYCEELYELAELAQEGCFDVIGHVNYHIRYMSPAARARLDLTAHYNDLAEIFRVVAQRGKGIEVNTSGLRREVNALLPSPEVQALFARAGGKIVTVGSDAHNARHVGCGLDEAMESLRDAGFAECAFFEGRKPVMYEIA